MLSSLIHPAYYLMTDVIVSFKIRDLSADDLKCLKDATGYDPTSPDSVATHVAKFCYDVLAQHMRHQKLQTLTEGFRLEV